MPPRIDPDLKALFDWAPKRLNKHPGGTASRASRKSSFYDRHLSDRHILKRVEKIDTLLEDIVYEVDNIMGQIKKRLPPYANVMSSEYLKYASKKQSRNMANEIAVTEAYTMTTGNFCVPAASLFAFYPDLRKWTPVLTWSMSSTNNCFAIADGILQPITDQEDYWHELDEKMKAILAGLHEKYPVLATWEIKSLTVGDEPVMAEIQTNIGTRFPWTKCKDSKGCKIKPHPNHMPPIGADGNGLRLHSSISQAGHNSSSENENDPNFTTGDGLTAQNYLQQAWAQAVAKDTTFVVLHSGNHEYIGVRHRATQTLYLSNLFEPHAFEGYGKLHIGLYACAVRDARSRLDKFRIFSPENHGGGGGDQEDSNDRSKGEGDDDDDRGPDQGGGGGVRIRRVDMKQKGRAQGTSKARDGAVQEKSDHGHDRDGGCLKGDKMAKVRPPVHHSTSPSDAFDMMIQQSLKHLSACQQLCMYLQFGVYDSPIPATFARILPLSSDKMTSSTPSTKCMTLILTSTLGQGATGVAHGGILQMDIPGQHLSLDVVAKLAFEEDQRERLKDEFSIYQHLTSKGVKHIPTLLGLFEDVEDCALGLVLTYAGAPIKGQLSVPIQLALKSALDEIHNAGILHGDIRSPNLLVDDSGQVAIIDFDQSVKKPSTQAVVQEMKSLLALIEEGEGGSEHSV